MTAARYRALRSGLASSAVPATSAKSLAEDRGFEPLRAFTQRAFQARALGHYANPPSRRLPEGEPHSPIGRDRRILTCLRTRLDWAQTSRVVVPHRTPPGPEGSKGRRALPGTRGVRSVRWNIGLARQRASSTRICHVVAVAACGLMRPWRLGLLTEGVESSSGQQGQQGVNVETHGHAEHRRQR